MSSTTPPAKSFPPRVLEDMKKRLPKCEPYVLAHGELNVGNLIVRDGALVGILDWEFAASWRMWYEYVSASSGWTEEDAEWNRLYKNGWRHTVTDIETQRTFGWTFVRCEITRPWMRKVDKFWKDY